MFFKGKINCQQPGGGTQNTEINKTAVCTSERLSEDLEDPHVNALCVSVSLSPTKLGTFSRQHTRAAVSSSRRRPCMGIACVHNATQQCAQNHETNNETQRKPNTANKALQSFGHTSTHTHWWRTELPLTSATNRPVARGKPRCPACLLPVPACHCHKKVTIN